MTTVRRRQRERTRFYCRPALLIVDEIGHLPVVSGGGNLFFQLVNARYEKGAMILTSNRGFAASLSIRPSDNVDTGNPLLPVSLS